jgi:apolipoprotein N-acyltransferase
MTKITATTSFSNAGSAALSRNSAFVLMAVLSEYGYALVPTSEVGNGKLSFTVEALKRNIDTSLPLDDIRLKFIEKIKQDISMGVLADDIAKRWAFDVLENV